MFENMPESGSLGESDAIFADAENLTSMTGDDRLTGNARVNVLIGLDGNDTHIGGRSADELDGLGGVDENGQ